MKKLLYLCLLLTTGCAVQANQPGETDEASTPTSTTTLEPLAARQTQLAEPTLTPTRTLEPTTTPSATLTPTPVVPPAHFELPGWLADPEAPVLLVTGEQGDIDPIQFLNAATGERYELPLERPIRFFWLSDGSGFGVIMSEEPQAIYIVNAATGDVHQLPDQVSYHDSYFPSGYLWNSVLFPAGEIADSNDFALLWSNVGLSPDGQWIYGREEHTRSFVENLVTGERILLTSLDDGLFDRGFGWSPDSTQLMILQADNLGGMAPEPCECLLRLYDVKTGQQMAVYEDDFQEFAWSLDGTQVLYLTMDKVQRSGWENDLCLLTLTTGQRRCFERAQSHPGWNTIMSARWMPDGNEISYIALGLEDRMSNAGSGLGGVCIFNLETYTTRCPTSIAQGDDIYVRWYDWSPDGRYLVFKTGNPISDVDHPGITALTTADGSIYREIGKLLIGTAWRPSVRLTP